MQHDDLVRGGGGLPARGEVLALRKFVAPEFIFGAGARALVGRYARNLGAVRVLLVTDPGVRAAGWAGEAQRALEAEGVRCVPFVDVSPNPRAAQVMSGAAIYRAEGCNALVAVGGGSSLDCAKGIGIVTANGGADIMSFEGVDEIPTPGPPLVCIPTTAGASADVSQFAIISSPERFHKAAIVSKSLVPDVALIDPETTVTMDASLTAATAMDALTHAIEACVSSANSPITDLHALAAISLIGRNLAAAVRRPADLEVRAAMMLASLHAGLAFSNASLGAVHAMAHALGGLLDIPHGMANAMLLSTVVAFNFEAAPDRYGRIAVALGAEPTIGSLVRAIEELRTEAGIGQRLADAGVVAGHLPGLVRHALGDACLVTNPRRPTAAEIEQIYVRAI